MSFTVVNTTSLRLPTIKILTFLSTFLKIREKTERSVPMSISADQDEDNDEDIDEDSICGGETSRPQSRLTFTGKFIIC